MAEGTVEGFDPLFTMDVVRDLMMANGGKLSNHTLVTHFKSFLNDSQRKKANRQMFKQYVNTLAVVKLDVSGEKLLVLKKKFRGSGSFRGEPPAAKFLPAGQGQTKAKRAKKDDWQTAASDHPTSDTEASNDDKENARKHRSGNVRDLPADEVNTVDDRTDEEVEIHSDGAQVTSELAGDVSTARSCTPDRLADNAGVEHSDVSTGDSSARAAVSDLQGTDDGPTAAVNVDHKTDVVDFAPVAANLPTKEQSTAEHTATEMINVREMAKQLNKADSPAPVTPRTQSTPVSASKTKRDRESRRNDDEFSLTESQREWIIKSAYSDYQVLAKLLQADPALSRKHDFLSGYTALHWAAKNGSDEVVKLLFGSKEPPDANARSHGGYTPLHVATIHGQEHVVRLLVEVYGANANVRDYSGRKPKHYFAHSGVSARVQQLLQPPPSAPSQRRGSNRSIQSVRHGAGGYAESLPSPGSSPGPSGRKGFDSGLMPPPRALPAVVRRRPVVSSSSVDSGVDQLGRDKQCHSDSEMHGAGSDTELHGGGSSPNVSAFV